MDFRLSDQTLEWKEYCRTFAREVIRPVAPQHDRDESVPYEVMQQAYEWNLAGLDWLSALQDDPEGLKGVIYAEELHWGCAGIALAISASSLCAAGIASSGTPEQIGRWIPEVFGSKEQPKLRRLRRHRAAGRLRRQVAAHDRQARRRRLDPQRHQDLHLERRHRRRHGRRRDGGPDARPPRPGVVHRHQGQPRADGSARRSRSSASARRRPPRSCSRTAAFPATPCSAARRSCRRSSSGRARARAPARRAPSPRSRSRGRPSARRRSASRRPPTSGRSSTCRSAARTAFRCSSSSASSRCSPTSRRRSRPPACWYGEPPGWGATASR